MKANTDDLSPSNPIKFQVRLKSVNNDSLLIYKTRKGRKYYQAANRAELRLSLITVTVIWLVVEITFVWQKQKIAFT